MRVPAGVAAEEHQVGHPVVVHIGGAEAGLLDGDAIGPRRRPHRDALEGAQRLASQPLHAGPAALRAEQHHVLPAVAIAVALGRPSPCSGPGRSRSRCAGSPCARGRRGRGLPVRAVLIRTPPSAGCCRRMRSARPSPLTSPAHAAATVLISCGPDHQAAGRRKPSPGFFLSTTSCAVPSASPRPSTATSARPSAWKSPISSFAPASGTSMAPSYQTCSPP